jgi:uncharacterized protein YjiS (DUF1127 family)
MTTVSDFNVPTQRLRTALVEYFITLREKIAKRTLYRATVSELSSLSGRDLADLGIHQSSIKNIAYEAAYGR